MPGVGTKSSLTGEGETNDGHFTTVKDKNSMSNNDSFQHFKTGQTEYT